MSQLENLRPKWRTKDISGYLSPWDGEWFSHFSQGGYDTIEWVEIEVSSPEQEAVVLNIIRKIHLPGTRIDGGFRIYGLVPDGNYIDFI